MTVATAKIPNQFVSGRHWPQFHRSSAELVQHEFSDFEAQFSNLSAGKPDMRLQYHSFSQSSHLSTCHHNGTLLIPDNYNVAGSCSVVTCSAMQVRRPSRQTDCKAVEAELDFTVRIGLQKRPPRLSVRRFHSFYAQCHKPVCLWIRYWIYLSEQS